MTNIEQIFIYIVAIILVFSTIYIFTKLASWARKGSRGIVIVTVTLLGGLFCPDPNFEKQVQIIQEEKRIKGSEDDTGDPPA